VGSGAYRVPVEDGEAEDGAFGLGAAKQRLDKFHS